MVFNNKKLLEISNINNLLVGVISLFYIGNFSKNISPDFSVFYSATVRMFSGQNVYFPETEPVPYNLPATYLILWPTSFFSLKVASFIFLILNLGLIFLVFKIVKQEFKFSLFETQVFAILFLTHYATRSTLNNGQLGILFIFLILNSWHLLQNKSRLANNLGLISLSLALELKPYLFLLGIVFFLISRKFKYLLSLTVWISILHILVLMINPSASLENYFKLISQRQDNIQSELDQISIYSNFLKIKVSSFNLFLILFIVQVIFVIVYVLKSKFNYGIIKFLFFVGSSVLVSTYFHRQDSLMLSLVLFVILIKNYESVQNRLRYNKALRSIFYFWIISIAQVGGSNLIAVVFMQLIFLYTSTYLIKLPNKRTANILLLILNILILTIYEIKGWESSYLIWVPITYLSSIASFVLIYFLSKDLNLREKFK